MGGELLILGVALVTVLLGGGLGYAFAALRFGGELQTVNFEKQRLEQQLAAAPKQGQSAAASAQVPAVSVPVTSAPAQATSAPAAPETTNSTNHTSAAANSFPPLPSPASSTMSAADSDSPRELLLGRSDPSTTTQSWQHLIAETASRAQSDVLCMVDIDFLRQYRERYGAELSDYVVQHVERAIRDTLQHHDAVISRYEGQELVIVWPAAIGHAAKRLQEARTTAARIRKCVEEAFLQVGTERLTVTVSIGLALCEAALPGEHVIARADEALAAAKRAGRNRGYFHNGTECLPIEPLSAASASSKESASQPAVTPKRSTRKGGQLERRRHERKPCSNINLIAPCTDNNLPSIEVFQRVQFFDISSSGFSMIVSTVPLTSQFAVALINSKGMIFMAAEVANIRQSKRMNADDKPLLIIGCRFRQRLYPHTNGEEKEARRMSGGAPRVDEPLATVR